MEVLEPLSHDDQACLLVQFFSEDRYLYGCDILVAKSPVEDCLQLSFRYVAYQTLAHVIYYTVFKSAGFSHVSV